MTDKFREPDNEARQLAARLMQDARFGALGTLDPDGGPAVTRVAVALIGDCMVTLTSDLAPHTAAMRARPETSLLVGEPGAKGDPLTHPRLTLMTTAEFLPKADLRDRWLALQPKSTLYVDFADFHFVALRPRHALLNGGFGKAFRLTPADLPGA